MIFPGAYLAVALTAYVVVFRAPPDGLANLPLAVAHLPIIILERILTEVIYGSMDGYLWKPLVEIAGLPSGYILYHVYWFLPLTMFQAYCFFLLGKWLDRKR